jgi:hypothetical protein
MYVFSLRFNLSNVFMCAFSLLRCVSGSYLPYTALNKLRLHFAFRAIDTAA